MTIAQIMQGIVNALYSSIVGIKIYTESVKQNLDTPCVLVKCLNPSQGLDLGRRYSKSLQFAIQYFPNTDNVNAECNMITDQMFDALENITVNGRILHGKNMNSETNDDVLTFTVNYDVFLIAVESSEQSMNDVRVDVGID